MGTTKMIAGKRIYHPSPEETRACIMCGETFISGHKLVVTCSEECRTKRKIQTVRAAQDKVKLARKSADLPPPAGVPSVAEAPVVKAPEAKAPKRAWAMRLFGEPAPAPVAETLWDKVPGLPRTDVALCKAVCVGVECSAAAKLGVFYILNFGGDGYRTFLPWPENRLSEAGQARVVMIVRLGQDARWHLRKPEEAGDVTL